MTSFLAIILIPVLLFSIAFAHVRPTAEEEQQLKDSGEWEAYMQHLRDSGHHRMSPVLVKKAKEKVQRTRLKAIGYSDTEVVEKLAELSPLEEDESAAIPGGRGTMSSLGTVKTMVIVVEFADYRLADPDNDGDTSDAITLANIASNCFGSGTTTANTNHPGTDSVTDYFDRASNGALAMTGDVFLHTMPLTRENYEPADTSSSNSQFFYDTIIKPALDALDATVDMSEYDSDGNGEVDSCNIIFCGPNGAWATYWWGFSFGASVGAVTYDGVTIEDFTRQRLALRSTNDFNPGTLIHELGHKLGLPDIYDYDGSVGNNGGVGGIGMMGGSGDINPFFKWILDWQDPTVISTGAAQTVTLNARGDTSLSGSKAYAIWPNLTNTDDDDLLTEFFIVENSQDVGNDSDAYRGEGVLIWHIDAEWGGSASYGYVNDNSYTTDKLIKVVQADGLSEIESGSRHDADDFWAAGQSFTPTSTPSSAANDGFTTAVMVDNISANGNTMTLDIGFNMTGVPENVVLNVRSSANVNSPVLVTAFASDPDGDSLTYQLAYGDGNSTEEQISRHSYGAGGTYTVGLNVSDGNSFPVYVEQDVVVSDPLDTLTEFDTIASGSGILEAAGDYLFAGLTWELYVYDASNDTSSTLTNSDLGGYYYFDAAHYNGSTYAFTTTRWDGSSSAYRTAILYTTDLTNWDYAYIGDSLNIDLPGLTYTDGIWTVVGDGGYVATSSDLTTWVERSSGVTDDCLDVTEGNGRLIATVDGDFRAGNLIYSDDAGLTWTAVPTLPADNVGWFVEILWDGERFILMDYWGGIYYSPDGLTWTESDYYAWKRNRAIAYGGERYLMLHSDQRISAGSDYTSWTAGEIELQTWTNTTYYNNRFFLMNSDGTIYQTNQVTDKQDTWLVDAGAASFDEDLDGDGIPALMEYAIGDSESEVSTTSDLLQLSAPTATGVTISMSKPADRDDIIYTIQRSTTLAPDSWVDTGITVTSEDDTALQVFADATADTDLKEFYRLKVELAE